MTLARALATNLAAIALFVAAGWGLVSCVPALRTLPWSRRLGHQYLLGLGSVSAAAWIASHVLHLSLRATVLWPLALAPVALGLALLWRRSRAAPEAGATTPSPRSPLAAVTFLVAAIATVAAAGLLAEAVSEPVHDYDGTMTWSAAARWIRAERTVDATVLRDRRLYVTHPEYPVLLPLAQVVVHELFDTGGDERAVRGIYAAFFPALLLVVLDGAWRLAGRRAALLAVLTLALVPGLAGERDGGGSASTYCDVPLACFWGAGLVLLLRKDAEFAGGTAAGILLGAGVLTKSEGLPLASVALVLAGLEALARSRRRRLPWAAARGAFHPVLAASAVTALATALLRSWRSAIPLRFTEEYKLPGAVTLLGAMSDRLPLVPAPALRETLDWNVWGGLWLIVPLALVAGAVAFRRRPLRPFLLALGAALGMIAVAYSVTWWPGAVLVHPTWNRFLFQMSVPGSLVLAAALRPSLRRWGAAPAARRGRWLRRAWRFVALVPFLLPLLVLLSRPWPPAAINSDQASLELYTLQATHGETLVGPYSRFGWNHPGPVLFYAYAPLYALSGQRSASLPLSALLLNLGAAAALLTLLARWGGRRVAVPVALLVVGHAAAAGPAGLADPWNPFVTMLPLGLFLTFAALEPRGCVPVALTAIGSFLVQSHLGFAPIVAVIGVLTAVRLAIASRRGVPVRRAVLASLGVAALLWALPIVEELRGHPGNLTSIVRFFGERKGHHTLAEVIDPLARQLARAPLGVATAVVPSTSDDRGTGSGLLALLLVGLLPLAASAAHRAGRRFERNLAILTLVAIGVAYQSLTGVVEGINDYLIAWVSVAGAVGWGLVIASIPGIRGRIGRRALGVALALVSLLAVRLGTAQIVTSPPASLRTIPQIDELASASQRFLATSGVKRPLLVLATHDAWPCSLGLVLELAKRGVHVSAPEEWAVMFGRPFLATGAEDGALVLAEEPLDRVATVRPDAVRLAARDGIALYGLTGPPPAGSRRSGELE